MPTLVRKLNNPHWLKPVGGNSGQPQADALKNFNTLHNNLSVYEVADGEYDAASLAVAVAAGTDRLQEVHFVVFDCKLVTELGIPINKTQGGTPDQYANALHRNLRIGTPKKLCALTEAIIYHRLEIERLLQPDVEKRVVNAIKNGSIDPKKLRESMREALQKSHPGLLNGGTQ